MTAPAPVLRERDASGRPASGWPPRILLLAPDLFGAIGGIQTFNRALVFALDELAARHGGGIEVLALNDHHGNGLEKRYMPRSRARYAGFGGSRRRFALAAVRAALRADVVLFGHVNFAPLALAMPGRTRHLAVYGVDVWRRLSRLERAGVRRMRRLLSISRFTQEQMLEHNGGDPGRFTLFPVSLDPLHELAPDTRDRRALGLPDGPLILSVARLAADERYKGVDTLIRALPAVLERVPGARYVVVGTGTDLERLQALARQCGVAERVVFAGRVPDADLYAYYRLCDVFALPSWREGFGIVFLEAMRMGKPCVTVAAGAAPEVVEDGVTGAVVPPDDPAALGRALTGLLSDDTRRRRLGDAGRERLERHFTFEMFRERLEGVLLG